VSTTAPASLRPASRDEVVNHYQDRNHKQCVNQPATNVTDQSQQPEHNENRYNRPKHNIPPENVFNLSNQLPRGLVA
jgi:hypothetical protein